MFDEVVPEPALPAVSDTPVLSSVMTLVASVVEADGVSVAVHVVPPSDDVTELSVPLSIVRSAFVKPVTASLNVIVTSEVSPIFSDVSATTIVAVGRTVSTA